MASNYKKTSKKRLKVLKVLSIIANILFIPALALTIIMLGVFSGSKPLNNIKNGRELDQFKVEERIKGGWGYYKVPVLHTSSGPEQIYFAQNISKEDIEVGIEIVFYDVVEETSEELLYKISVAQISGTLDIEEKTYFTMNGDISPVPYENIIGAVIEDIPVFYKFIIANFHSTLTLVLLGVVPLMFVLTIFVIDGVVFVKTKKGTVKRNEIFTKSEEEYLDQVQRSYSDSRRPDDLQKVDPVNKVVTDSQSTSKPDSSVNKEPKTDNSPQTPPKPTAAKPPFKPAEIINRQTPPKPPKAPPLPPKKK